MEKIYVNELDGEYYCINETEMQQIGFFYQLQNFQNKQRLEDFYDIYEQMDNVIKNSQKNKQRLKELEQEVVECKTTIKELKQQIEKIEQTLKEYATRQKQIEQILSKYSGMMNT